MTTSPGGTVESFETYTQGAERDEQGTGDLPTYNDIAAQSGPNSRCADRRPLINTISRIG
jgi:hypothetical protein